MGTEGKKPKKRSGGVRQRAGETFGFGGSFTGFGSKLFDVWMLGVLWLVCSIPVFTIGASTTALYYAIIKSVKSDDGYASTMFFRSFKRNFKQGTILWIVVVAVFMLMRLNTGILEAKTSSAAGIFMIGFYTAVMVYVILTALYMFPALARFDMDTFWFLRVGIYMVIRYFLTSLMLAVIFGGALALVYRFPFLLFVLPGPTMWLMSEFLERVLDKHAPDKHAPDGET